MHNNKFDKGRVVVRRATPFARAPADEIAATAAVVCQCVPE